MQPYSVPLKFGNQIITRINDPAAGANFTFTPHIERLELLYSIIFDFDADANAANRSAQIDISDGTGVIQRIGTNQTVTANQNHAFSVIGAAGNFENGNFARDTSYIEMPPDLILPRTSTVTSNFANIQVGDQIANVIIITYAWQRP